MHDIDRALTEMEAEGEYEDEFSGEYEGEYESEYEGEYEGELEGAFEMENEAEWEYESFEAAGGLDPSEEMELASDLLSVSSEEELDQFLGKLVKKVSRKAGKFLRSKTGRGLVGVLKGVAKTALPVVGGAVGSMVAPGIGTAIGSRLGSAVGGLFEMEMEGLSPEDQEFEVARRVVKVAAQAAKNATKAPKNAPAAKVVKAAIVAAAKKHAPGLVKKEYEMPYSSRHYMRRPYARRPHARRGYRRRRPVYARRQSGRWYRRGSHIILAGV